MRKPINRRAFLRTAASASAVAAGAGAAIASAVEQPDAELIALGIRFDRVFPQLRPANEALLAARRAFEASYVGDMSTEEFWDAREQAEEVAGRRVSRLFGLVDAIADRVRETPASTFAGLAVKARALKHDLCMPCDDPRPRNDWDHDDECLANFIDEVGRMARAERA